MAKSKNPNSDSVAPAPVAAQPVASKQNEASLKGNMTSRYSRSATAKADRAELLATAAPAIAPAAETEDELRTRRFIQKQLMEASVQDVTAMNIDTWIKTNAAHLGADFSVDDPIDRAFARFQTANWADREATAAFEASEYTPHIYNPRLPSSNGSNRRTDSGTQVIDDGFKAPVIKLSADERRTNLAAAIKTVSESYAGEAGMSAKDFAHVMAGIATIESRFGVLREVKGTKYASSAGGAFHYLNGTIAGEVRNNISDPRIAERVAFLGVNIKDGISKGDAWTLKEDDVLAGSILAKQIVETVRRNPELAKDIEELATRVYQSHNLGEAGARRLARGGISAMKDQEMANNPMFFRGATSDGQVQDRYEKFVTSAIKSSASFVDVAFGGAEALASAKPPQKPAVTVAALQLPERAPA